MGTAKKKEAESDESERQKEGEKNTHNGKWNDLKESTCQKKNNECKCARVRGLTQISRF